MADQPQHELLLDLLYEEDLSEDEQREAERLLEDDAFRGELENHRELLAYIRSETEPVSPSEEVDDQIIEYARRAASDTESTSDPSADASGSSGGDNIVDISTLSVGRTLAAAAVMTCVLGLVIFLTSETRPVRNTPTQTTEQSRDAPSDPKLAKTGTARDKQKSADAGVPLQGEGTARKADTDQPSAAVAAKTDTKPRQPDTAVGTGTKMAGRPETRDRQSTDEPEPPPNTAPRRRKQTESRLEPEPSSEASSSASGGAVLDQIEPQTSRDDDARSGEAYPDLEDEQSRGSTRSKADQGSPQAGEAPKEAGGREAGAPSDETDVIPTRVRTMIRAWESNNYESALSNANRLLADPESRDVDVSPDGRPTRTAHYFALTYKLRSLVDLKRWPEARATLSILRRHFPDAEARLQTIVQRIPGRDAGSNDVSGTTAPASDTGD